MASITRTIREQVTDQIRDDVVSGKFPAGQALRESELAERFGVSRGPVRDAFLQLSQEGFLAYQANRGVTVRNPPDSEDHEFLVSLRQQIECHVIKRGLEKINEADWKQLEKALVELESACQTEAVVKVAKADMKFHEEILEACGGTEFLPLWKKLCSQMLLGYSRLENYAEIHAEHASILEALKSGRTNAVTTAIIANIQ